VPIVQESSLDFALAHMRSLGDADMFPVPFEYEAIASDWQRVLAALRSEDVRAWTTRPHRTLLAPKARHGFRVATQLDPLDALLYVATTREIADDLEARRIPVAAGRVYSYRVRPTDEGHLFDPAIGYREFLAQCATRLDTDPTIRYVATTDIADFYARISHRELERALRSATTHDAHVQALLRLVSGWSGGRTFGIPNGAAPSRLLAEVTVADVDDALLAEGIDFVRFNDDYRIFARSYAEAYGAISFLAETLYRTHGLSLQPQKTAVFACDQFRNRFLSALPDRELDVMKRSFQTLAAQLKLETWYDDIDHAVLSEEQRQLVDALNLKDLFRAELIVPESDATLMRFVLRRLAQLGDDGVVEDVLTHLDVVHPLLPDICRYLASLRSLTPADRLLLGERLLALLDDSVVSALEYHRMWILTLFSASRDWGGEERLLELSERPTGPASARELILALGSQHGARWSPAQGSAHIEHTAWTRRAVLAVGGTLDADARAEASGAREEWGDVLEGAVIRWAESHAGSVYSAPRDRLE
jgi:hypothetical protein